jgi:hypothetical protein
VITRDVPFSVRLQAYFGGIVNQFGWLFGSFGLVFFWVFGMNADLSFLTFAGEKVTTTGVVTNCADTGASSNEVPIFENHYRYFDRFENEYRGLSYATGHCLKKNQDVEVQYLEKNPKSSRIAGMRRKLFSPAALFVLIFPVVGLAFILFGIKGGIKTVKLLKYGLVAQGVLKSKVATNTRINKQLVYALTFEFADKYGQIHHVSHRTHLLESFSANAEKLLLYLRHAPEKAQLTDALPEKIVISKNDRIESVSSLGSLAVIIVPALSMVGHGLYLYLRFGR